MQGLSWSGVEPLTAVHSSGIALHCVHPAARQSSMLLWAIWCTMRLGWREVGGWGAAPPLSKCRLEAPALALASAVEIWHPIGHSVPQCAWPGLPAVGLGVGFCRSSQPRPLPASAHPLYCQHHQAPRGADLRAPGSALSVCVFLRPPAQAASACRGPASVVDISGRPPGALNGRGAQESPTRRGRRQHGAPAAVQT